MGLGSASPLLFVSSSINSRWPWPQLQLRLTASYANRLHIPLPLPLSSSSSSSSSYCRRFSVKGFEKKKQQRRRVVGPCSTMMLHHNPVVSDLYATGFSVVVAVSLLRLWEETAKRKLFDQKLNRKLVHITIGLAFILCWPLFGDGYQGVVLAALTPGVNIIRMLLIGSGMWKDDATVKSMTRYGDRRELLKGPLYYAGSITFACIFYWRTSPIAIAAVCNLCAGDGMADVVGRRFGTVKLPYNQNKSVAGTIAMAVSGFVASLGFMHYFASFGFVQESWEMALGFLVVSLASALVESLPISTELDDNLTVTLTSMAIGNLIF